MPKPNNSLRSWDLCHAGISGKKKPGDYPGPRVLVVNS